nr:hypothetical protein [Tanacetum cinerariifolium]
MIDNMKSIVTQSALDVLYEKFHIPDTVHPELPGHNDRIRNSPTEMDLLAFINHADPTKVWIGEKEVREGNANVNEGGGDAAITDQVEEGDHAAQDKEANIVRAEDEKLVEKSTLNVEVGVTAADTVPFVTSFGTPTMERGDGEPTNSIFLANLRTQRPYERFVISSDYSHDSSANAADDEVTSIVRFSMSPPPLMIAAIATIVIAGAISASVFGVGAEPVPRSIFKDFASPSTAEADVVGPSQPVGAETSIDTFLVSQNMDSKTFSQIYMPKLNFNNDSTIDDPEACFSAEVRLRSEHNYTKRKKFERRCARLTGLLREKDVKAAEAARSSELDGLKEQNAALEGQVVALESVALSYDELSIKAASHEFGKDKLIDQVSTLEGTGYGLHDEVMGYNLFKERIEVVQDEQVKVLSDKVDRLDADLIGMALHSDEEFYTQYLTALGGAIGRAIDKGMQGGMVVGIDHGKARKGIAEVGAYNPSTEANYISAMSALCAMDFLLLAQLESHKDAIIADIMGLLHLEGSTAETSEASQLQPSLKQFMLPIHQLEDQVVIGETSLSFSLDVAHARV